VTVLGREGGPGGTLYNRRLVSMDEEGGFQPSDATGFIRCQAVRLREYQRFKQGQ
jgi:argininosuccinate synthase